MKQTHNWESNTASTLDNNHKSMFQLLGLGENASIFQQLLLSFLPCKYPQKQTIVWMTRGFWVLAKHTHFREALIFASVTKHPTTFLRIWRFGTVFRNWRHRSVQKRTNSACFAKLVILPQEMLVNKSQFVAQILEQTANSKLPSCGTRHHLQTHPNPQAS